MLNNTAIISIDKNQLDILVAILSIMGGLFGGIPAIIKWINRPKFRIKDFNLENYEESATITFSIINEERLSKDATELEIKCFLLNEDFNNTVENGLLSDDRMIPMPEKHKSKILMDALPKGASTNILAFRPLSADKLNNFKFLIFLKCNEGETKLVRRQTK